MPSSKKPAEKKVVAKKAHAANNKTVATADSVDHFIASIEDPIRQADARIVTQLMQKVTGHAAKLWGPAIIGFGTRTLIYETGRTMEWLLVGFSPRKANTSLYLATDFPNRAQLLAKLGKHTTGKSCLYIKQLAHVDLKVLEDLVKQSVKAIAAKK